MLMPVPAGSVTADIFLPPFCKPNGKFLNLTDYNLVKVCSLNVVR